jgi:hypothetical protein
MNARIKEMMRVATARLGGEQQQQGGGGASSSGLGRRESTARLGGAGTSFRRQPQPMAPTVRTVYCNDREANAPVGYKVRRLVCSPVPLHSVWSHRRLDLGDVSCCGMVGLELDRLARRASWFFLGACRLGFAPRICVAASCEPASALV